MGAAAFPSLGRGAHASRSHLQIGVPMHRLSISIAVTALLGGALLAGASPGTAHSAVRGSGAAPAKGVKLIKVSKDPYSGDNAQHATEAEPDTFHHGNTIVSASQVGRVLRRWLRQHRLGDQHRRRRHLAARLAARHHHRRRRHLRARQRPGVAYDAKHDLWMISGLVLDGNVNGRGVVVSTSSDGIHWNHRCSRSGTTTTTTTRTGPSATARRPARTTATATPSSTSTRPATRSTCPPRPMAGSPGDRPNSRRQQRVRPGRPAARAAERHGHRARRRGLVSARVVHVHQRRLGWTSAGHGRHGHRPRGPACATEPLPSARDRLPPARSTWPGRTAGSAAGASQRHRVLDLDRRRELAERRAGSRSIRPPAGGPLRPGPRRDPRPSGSNAHRPELLLLPEPRPAAAAASSRSATSPTTAVRPGRLRPRSPVRCHCPGSPRPAAP